MNTNAPESSVPGRRDTLAIIAMGVICAPVEHRLWVSVGLHGRAAACSFASMLAWLALAVTRAVVFVLFPLTIPALYLLARHECRRVARLRVRRQTESDDLLGL